MCARERVCVCVCVLPTLSMHTSMVASLAPPRPTVPPPQAPRATPKAAAAAAAKAAAAMPPPPFHTRRAVLLASAALAGLCATPASPATAGGLSHYVKKRGRVDPLSSFVPPVLDARAQLARLGDEFGACVGGGRSHHTRKAFACHPSSPLSFSHPTHHPKTTGDPVEARLLLRSGAFEGLRDNVRAVGEYAVAAVTAAGASPASTTTARLAPDFFAAVQALDFVFFKAARDGVPVPAGAAQARLDAAVTALDALLATVPADVLAGARAVVEATASVGGGKGAQGGAAAAAAAAALAQVLPEAVGG